MTEGERNAMVESAQNIEDALIKIERVLEDERNLTNYILRELLRAVRLLLVDRLR